MKKIFVIMIAFSMLGNTIGYAAEESKNYVTAKPTVQKVVLDGHSEMMQCYEIEGYYYFRLRDIAQVVTENIEDSDYHFNISYDKATKFTKIVLEEDYLPSENAAEYIMGSEEKQAVQLDSEIDTKFDDIFIMSDGYIVDGYAFYNLQKLALWLGLNFVWCEEEQALEFRSKEPEWDRNTYLAAKPVVYLYPEEETEVSVKLDFAGELTVTYPAYNDGWEVMAQPDGTLTNHADGKEYSYLFWEGEGIKDFDFSEGFVVKGEDAAEFLQEKLAEMGLTARESNEFIVYWLPRMQENPYNLISFQWENYEEAAKLEIIPEPDHILRVFMAFKGINKSVEIPEQALPRLEREGFVVVEWGGTEVN